MTEAQIEALFFSSAASGTDIERLLDRYRTEKTCFCTPTRGIRKQKPENTKSINQREGRMAQYEPKIIAFLCNWCAYAGADLAGVSRLQYPANLRPVRVMCSGRVDPVYIVDALRDGADGVLVSG
jgi:F420-non-reducing hydrogenase iron-sulfur subunit